MRSLRHLRRHVPDRVVAVGKVALLSGNLLWVYLGFRWLVWRLESEGQEA